ncbi:MAG: phosphoenolpyruvate carboxykinase (GTP) [Candidatus Omnitrophota bacterium]|nr:phosphoenolpyruvate carboxykinase (GTP) [Candidatus Omnitrophota bacterium]
MRSPMEITNAAVRTWVENMARLTHPDQIVWLNGSDEEYRQLLAEGVRSHALIELNQHKHPGCYLHRSHPSDVARTEQCTFICTPSKDDAGPTNNWMAPEKAYATLRKLFNGIMRGRTMYVVPYLMGPKGSPFSKVGIELTDSVYVALNMRIMTRMGDVALEHLGGSTQFIKGLHSVGTLDPQNRYICHFPQDLTIYSINSGYGGNALLSKKCFALRIASWLGRQEGWLAEHMLIMGVEDPKGKITYIAAAFPSACGKTNLAMLQPPAEFQGYRIWCVGDDIAWLRPGPDGRLYAINPEAGFFGVAPGTSWKTNPNMMRTIAKNTLFTNVGMAPDKTVWWEGLDLLADTGGFVDWQGKLWDPTSGQKAAHPNSRFTTPIKQCPVYSPTWEDSQGVPISAILFGCRRSKLVPLVYEAFSWAHGVYLGATLNSETTAAAAGATGVVRRDPMAMLPFCGYNMADYFAHWLEVGKQLTNPPKTFRVNWFRVNDQGQFIWPGFGENLRIIRWIIDRCQDRGEALKTPIGYLPTPEALGSEESGISSEGWETLLGIDRGGWLDAARRQTEFFEKFGVRLPAALWEERQALIDRLKSWPLAARPSAEAGAPAVAVEQRWGG